jgi:hypothetical protein
LRPIAKNARVNKMVEEILSATANMKQRREIDSCNLLEISMLFWRKSKAFGKQSKKTLD